jgi:hypothetical protein
MYPLSVTEKFVCHVLWLCRAFFHANTRQRQGEHTTNYDTRKNLTDTRGKVRAHSKVSSDDGGGTDQTVGGDLAGCGFGEAWLPVKTGLGLVMADDHGGCASLPYRRHLSCRLLSPPGLLQGKHRYWSSESDDGNTLLGKQLRVSQLFWPSVVYL